MVPNERNIKKHLFSSQYWDEHQGLVHAKPMFYAIAQKQLLRDRDEILRLQSRV